MSKDQFRTLLIRLKKGDRKSLSALYRQFYKELYHYGLKLVRNDVRVEDTIQDLFLDLHKRGSHLGDIENVRSYLYVAFRRRLIHNIRQHSKDGNLISLVQEGEIIFYQDDILEMTHNKFSSGQKLHAILNDLPTMQKEALYLKYYNKLSSKEIAETLDTTPQVVLNAIYRAYKTLRKNKELKEMLLNFSA